jgi:multidrug resistance efflux pump
MFSSRTTAAPVKDPTSGRAAGIGLRRPITVLMLVAAALAAWASSKARIEGRNDVVTEPARFENMQPTITARGDIEPVESNDVLCNVKACGLDRAAAPTIRWIIANGAGVHRGQLVCEFEDGPWRQALGELKAPLEMARADWVYTCQNCDIVASQNQSDTQTAEVAVRLAAMDLEKYLRGDYEQTRKELENRISLAESDLEQWRERINWTERMVRKGFMNGSEARAGRAGMQSAQLDLERLRDEYRVLEKYTRKRVLHELETRLAKAKSDLRRAKIQARAKTAQAEAARAHKDTVYHQRLARFQEIEAQLPRCVLTAPNDGVVAYAAGTAGEWAPPATGEQVSCGQRLMSVSNLLKMEVKIGLKDHAALVSGGEDSSGADPGDESDIASRFCRLRALWPLALGVRSVDRSRLYQGEPALIRLRAFPERVLRGHVRQATALAPRDSAKVDIERLCAAQITVDDRFDGLRPSMLAEVTILEKPVAHVLAVPLRAILPGADPVNESLCFVDTADGPEERNVTIGRHTSQMAEVRAGIMPGERIVVNPQRLLGRHGSSFPVAP